MPLDEARIRLWRSVQLLHGWSQAVALHAGLFAREGPDDRNERVPPVMIGELRRFFGESLERGGRRAPVVDVNDRAGAAAASHRARRAGTGPGA